jgi:hypothetical protein
LLQQHHVSALSNGKPVEITNKIKKELSEAIVTLSEKRIVDSHSEEHAPTPRN